MLRVKAKNNIGSRKENKEKGVYYKQEEQELQDCVED
mgnify:CR=1 FL=1